MKIRRNEAKSAGRTSRSSSSTAVRVSYADRAERGGTFAVRSRGARPPDTPAHLRATGVGSLAPTRIEADAPFHLDRIRLQMAHLVPFGGGCDATIPFEVELFRGMGALPDADPEVVETFAVAASDIIDYPVFQIDLEPTTSVDLAAGEALFVAVHMETALDGRAVCFDTCTDPVVDGLDGWSQATEPPYTWVPLTDFGVSVNLDVLLIGSPG